MNQRPLRVVTALPLPTGFPSPALAGRVEIQLADTPQTLENAVRDADVLFSWRVPDIVPAGTPDLRWIQLPSAGADNLVDHPVWRSDILITASKGIHTVPMSEHLFAMLLSLVRQIPAIVRGQDQHEWLHGAGLPMGELWGRTMGILGWGKIGDGAAHLARAFGMRVVGTRFSAREPERTARDLEAYANPPYFQPPALEADMLYPASALRQVLGQSDVVVAILPLTRETRHLLGESEFRAMRPGALFCNIGRGQVVDEAALIRALRSGRLAGAGLDVFDEEPLPPSSPLWSMPNVIVSPHLGGASARTSERAIAFFALNLERYLRGETPLNVVERSQEY